jgi:hypothetical protein
VLKKVPAALVMVLALANSLPAFAWSSAGHKIIARIAADHISPATKAKIAQLMGSEDMMKSAWWPDTIKSQTAWKHTKGYHFEELDDGVDYFESLETASDYVKKKGDVIRALVKAEDVLRDTSASSTRRQYALRFLLHFAGDVHQPLHAGYRKDVGGNTIKMDWFGSSRNLHSVWDGGLISEYAYRNKLPQDTLIESYAADLPPPLAGDISIWNQTSIYEWYEESVAARNEVYIGITSTSETYYSDHIELNNLRIQQAGFRLAHWLDQIFAGAPLSGPALKLRQRLAHSLGDGTSDILLEPKP